MSRPRSCIRAPASGMLNNIQLLRAAAACGVVLFHMSPLELRVLRPAANVLVHGVDLFFVISGFIMVYIATRDALSPAGFIRDRILRIVPLYWLLTAVAFLVVTATAVTPGSIALLKSLLFVAYDRGHGVVMPVLFPGWTLNYEMLFYGLFALALFARPMALRVGLIGTVLAGLALAGALLRPQDPLVHFYTSPRLLEFVFGMALGLFHPRIAASPPPLAVAIASGVAGVALVVACERMLAPDVGLAGIGVASTMIVYSALALEAQGWRCENRAVLLVGSASYALYLSHVLVVLPGVAFVRRHGVTHGPVLAGEVLLLFGVAILLGIAIHLAVERPLNRWLRQHLAPDRRGNSVRG